MKALHQLIHSLSKSEKKIVRTSLTSFSSRKDVNTKTLSLFDFLVKSKEYVPNNGECAAHLYNNKRDKRFKMLKLRFKEKLLDAIALDINLHKNETLDPIDQIRIKIRKKLLQFSFLQHSKGNQAILSNLLDEVIDLSKKSESYNQLTEALFQKKASRGFIKGEKDFDKINEEINFYEKCTQSANKANDYYYRLIMRNAFSARTDKVKMQQYLAESIRELKEDYEYTKSATVGYYLKFMEMAYFENAGNYSQASQACLDLLSIVKSNKAVYRKSRLFILYANMCQFNIFLHQYKPAVENSKLAQSFISPSSNNYIISKEWEFNALFYNGEFAKAETVITWLIEQISKSQTNDFRLAQYRFYFANILFKKGDFKTALKELNLPFEISKDKAGWDTAIRMLTIMTLIELERFDEASTRLANLKKHMERNVSDDKQSRREKKILKLLLLLEKYSFVLNTTEQEKVKKIIMLLESGDQSFKWRPLSSELIPFHTWFTEKFFKS